MRGDQELIGRGLFLLLITAITIMLLSQHIMLFIDVFVRLGKTIYPWLVTIGSITLGVALFFLLPLSIINRTRSFAASGLFIASLVFELNLWVLGFLVTHRLWGGWAVLLGLSIPFLFIVFLLGSRSTYCVEAVVLRLSILFLFPLLLLGGGVLIFAIFAALFNAMWPLLGELAFLFVFVVGLRKYGQYLDNK